MSHRRFRKDPTQHYFGNGLNDQPKVGSEALLTTGVADLLSFGLWVCNRDLWLRSLQ